jgi:hypothetical protein
MLREVDCGYHEKVHVGGIGSTDCELWYRWRYVWGSGVQKRRVEGLKVLFRLLGHNGKGCVES